ncbi:MAG: phospholipase A [Gammaproteobacteria bacterium]
MNQSTPHSRPLEAGFERDNLALLVRGWHRMHESADEDDNPDITGYLGWRRDRPVPAGGHSLSVMGRGNWNTGKGDGTSTETPSGVVEFDAQRRHDFQTRTAHHRRWILMCWRKASPSPTIQSPPRLCPSAPPRANSSRRAATVAVSSAVIHAITSK